MSHSLSDNYTIERASYNDHFLITSNALWENESISFQAKGLLGYLLSRPKDWIIHPFHLAQIYKGDKRGNGLDAIKVMIKELRQSGYITYQKARDSKGHWVHKYKVYPEPHKDFQKKFPEVVKPALVDPALVKPSIITSTELPNTDVCIVPQPAAVKKCVKTNLLGKQIEFSLQDVFSQTVLEKKDWSNKEIEEAWEIIERYNHPITEWFSFIEGTIKKIRIKKQNATRMEKLCHKKDIGSIKTLKTQSERRKDFYSESDTSERPLAILARQLGLK